MIKVIMYDSKKYFQDVFLKKADESKISVQFHRANISLDNLALSKGCDVVCVFVNDNVTREILEILKENGVKLIALRCAGFNNVDLKAAKELGIPVVRVPQYSPYAVAEHAISLLCTVNRKIHHAYNRVREMNFDISGLLGFDLYKKTMGVVGTGKIGKIFINICKGFGMNVIAYDLYPDHKAAKEIGFEYTDLDNLYKNSDIIALHCPSNPENYHMINNQSIAKMKDGVVIINTSRGRLVNTNELMKNLKSGKIGAVGLDVYEDENGYFFEDYSSGACIDDEVLSRLISFKNVIITSHQAFFTVEALDNIAGVTLDNIMLYFEKGSLENEVIDI